MSEFLLKQYHKGDIIFKEGTIGNTAYILKEGRIDITTEALGKKVILASLKPVSIFGEMAVLSKDCSRSATAEAAEYCAVVEIDKRAFDQYLEHVPPIITTVLHGLIERLKDTTRRVQPRTLDIFLSTCKILNLLAIHGKTEFPYDQTAMEIARILAVDISQVKEKLQKLETLNFIEIRDDSKGEKIIRLLQKDTFLEKASRIQQEIGWHL